MFIAVSGINGAGKSVFVSALSAHLRSDGRDTLVVAPLQSNTRLVRRFSSLPAPDHGTWMVRERWLLGYLTLAITRTARRQIQPALSAGSWVIADRWLIDHQINQAYFGASLSEWTPTLKSLPTPDVLIWVRTPAALALRRARESGAGKFGSDEDFHAYAVENYRHLLGDTAMVVDGTADPEIEAARVARRLRVVAGPTSSTVESAGSAAPCAAWKGLPQ